MRLPWRAPVETSSVIASTGGMTRRAPLPYDLTTLAEERGKSDRMRAPSNPSWLSYSASSWDEAESLGSAVYFHHEIAPIEAHVEAIDFRMDVLSFSGVTLGRTRYGAAITMQCEPLDGYHVIVPLVGTVAGSSGKTKFRATPSSGVIYNHSRPATVRRSAGSDHLALKLAREVVEGELSLLLGHRLREPLQFESEFTLGRPETLRWFGGLRMLSEALVEPRILASQGLLAIELRNLVVLGMLMGQRHNHTDELMSVPGASVSSSVARRAVQLLEADPARPWTIGALAAECSCSVRTLQATFQRVFGLSPSEYLQNLRMDCARRSLQAADGHEMTVSQVAHAWGFGHLGRFSVNYRSRFGESPSMTLRG